MNKNLNDSLVARQTSQTPNLGGRVSKNAGDAVDPTDLVTLRQLQDAVLKAGTSSSTTVINQGGGGGSGGNNNVSINGVPVTY